MDPNTFIQVSNLINSLWTERTDLLNPSLLFGLYDNNLLVTVDDSTSIITFINVDNQIMMIPKYKCSIANQSGINIYVCGDEPNIAYCSALNDSEKFVSKNIIPILLPYTTGQK